MSSLEKGEIFEKKNVFGKQKAQLEIDLSQVDSWTQGAKRVQSAGILWLDVSGLHLTGLDFIVGHVFQVKLLITMI